MTKLEELIEKLCPDGVEYKELNEVCRFQNGFAFKSRLFSESGLPILRITNILDGKLSNDGYVYFNQNDYKENLNNYIVKPNNIVVAMSGATTGKIGYNYFEKEYYLNQRVGMFLPDESSLLNRYLYHWLLGQSGNILAISSGTGAQPNLSSVKMMKFKLPVPPIPVQQEIVRILDNFTFLSAELAAELAARQKQYEYYRDSLLTFENEPDGTVYNIPWFSDILCKLCPEGVEYEEIGEIATLSAGGDVPKERFSKEKTEKFNIPIYSNGIEDKSLYGFTDLSKINDPCVTISARGTIGWAALRQEPFYPIVRLICVIPKERILAKFLKYVIDTIEFKVPVTGIPQLTVPMVSKYKIPVPPLVVQQRIVDILDRFDSLCNDISSGLPAEIEARQKQYEYYRDKLLSFKELKKEA